MTADNARRQARRLVCNGVLACAVGAGLCGATPAWAGKKTCLTGTDPEIANDAVQIVAVRAVVQTACPCASYDGSSGKTHGSYTSCTGRSITSEVGSGHLRNQCKATVKKYYSTSTCGVPASKGVVPCVKKTADGKVACTIKPSTKCGDTACDFRSCIDAADTDHDGIIGASDSGACAVLPLVDNGDGTITDTQVGGLTWEKKDQAGGPHDMSTRYTWAGLCGCDTGSCTGSEPLCQPDASAANACSVATGGARGCAECSSGTCTVDPLGVGAPTTIWDWLVQLNGSNFAGHNDWRIPTVGKDGDTEQLETIFDDTSVCKLFPPCVPAVFNTGCTSGCEVTGCSCTAPFNYWAATTNATNPNTAWVVGFRSPDVHDDGKAVGNYVRAVR
jgi:hypothetical protein